MRSTASVVCVLGLVVIATAVSSPSAFEIQLDWKDALQPCACVNGTMDCSNRRKTSVESEDVCDVAPTAVNLYNNLFVSFPDGFVSAVTVKASRNRLSAIPDASQLNPRLTILDLSRNDISNATSELRALSSLQTLDLRANRLSHLRFLPQSCDLKHLDVSHNLLVDLEGPLSRCTQLNVLNLNSNKLASLSSEIFSEMSHLEVLNLANNPISSPFSSQIFDNLTNLKTLDIYNTQLTSVPHGVFKSLSKLEKLDIGLNDLSSLPVDTFSSLINLKFLGIVRGNMQTFPTGIFSPISQLENLYLSVNFFTSLPTDAFIHLHNLKTLTLDFLNATLLPEHLFTNLTELQVLSLYGNHLTSLPVGLLSGLSKLEKVDISSNRWTELPLQQLRNVKQLSMGLLGITSLGPRMFAGNPHVNMLFLDNNNISFVAEEAFAGLSLEGLSIETNALNELPQNVFQALPNLKYIGLSRNILSSLPDGIFSTLHKLLVLELANNKLRTLPDRIFNQLSALEVLDLSSNELTAVSVGLFCNLRSLRKLALERNRLTVLPNVPPAHTAPLHVSLNGNAISLPDQQALRLWLSGENHYVVDLTDNGVSPSALRWILNEPQMRLGADALSPCGCGFVRRGRALLRLCVNASCTASPGQSAVAAGWVDALRSAAE